MAFATGGGVKARGGRLSWEKLDTNRWRKGNFVARQDFHAPLNFGRAPNSPRRRLSSKNKNHDTLLLITLPLQKPPYTRMRPHTRIRKPLAAYSAAAQPSSQRQAGTYRCGEARFGTGRMIFQPCFPPSLVLLVHRGTDINDRTPAPELTKMSRSEIFRRAD